MFVDEGILDGFDLCGDDRKHGDINSIELIKTPPGSALAQTRKQLPNSLRTLHHYNPYSPTLYHDLFSHTLKSMPSPQLVTTHSNPMALAKSLTVSVLPVPAGPAGAPPKCMERAWVIVR